MSEHLVYRREAIEEAIKYLREVYFGSSIKPLTKDAAKMCKAIVVLETMGRDIKEVGECLKIGLL